MGLLSNVTDHAAFNNSGVNFRYVCEDPFSGDIKTRTYHYTPVFMYASNLIGSFNVAAAIPTVLANLCLQISIRHTQNEHITDDAEYHSTEFTYCKHIARSFCHAISRYHLNTSRTKELQL